MDHRDDRAAALRELAQEGLALELLPRPAAFGADEHRRRADALDLRFQHPLPGQSGPQLAHVEPRAQAKRAEIALDPLDRRLVEAVVAEEDVERLLRGPGRLAGTFRRQSSHQNGGSSLPSARQYTDTSTMTWYRGLPVEVASDVPQREWANED